MPRKNRYICPLAMFTALPAIPLMEQLDMAADAGFDGVEVVTFRGVSVDQVEAAVSRVASRINRPFEVRFHEVWSLASGKNHWYNWIACAMGKIPRFTGPVSEQILLTHGNKRVFVGYAHRIRNSEDRVQITRHGKEGLLLQTCQVGDRPIEIHEFLTSVKAMGCKCVVFDTMHYLEWCTGGIGVSRLQHRRNDLPYLLVSGAAELLPFTAEVHLCDGIPTEKDTPGRNVIPGHGELPLLQFGDLCKEIGWTGYVTPEVQPCYAFKYPLPILGFGTRFRPEVMLREILEASMAIMER